MSFTTNTDVLTREFFDSIMVTPRYIQDEEIGKILGLRLK